MSSDADLRRLLSHAARGVTAPVDLPAESLRRGTRLLRRRRVARASGAVLSGVLMVAGGAAVHRVTAQAAELAVGCVGDAVTTRGRAVAGSDGVRIRATNATGDVMHLSLGGVGTYLAPGTSTVELPVPPGPVEVTCSAMSGVSYAASLLVRDPDNVFVSDALSCGSPQHSRLAEAAVVRQGDPVALTRQELGGRLPVDATVEPAGYPQASARTVRVRHGGEMVAVVRWHALPGADAWLLDSETVCPETSSRT